MARPKSEHPRNKRVHLRFSEPEMQQLEKRAFSCSYNSVSEYLRSVALSGKVEAKREQSLTDRHTEIQLRRIGNNLNQLARAANSGQPVADVQTLQDLRVLLNHIQDKL